MNWKQIIHELMESGVTQAEIGTHIERSQGYISDLYSGRRKGLEYTAGQKLISLHAEKCSPTEKAA
jgi:predicted transcriptional regulator